jgi:hypothetical protein
VLVLQDRAEVVIGEPAGQRRSAERLVDRGGAVQLGERDRFGHLRPDPSRPGGSRLDQPRRRAVADGQERRLGRVSSVWCPLPRHSAAAGMIGRVMLVADLRAAPLPARVTGDLPRAGGRVDDGDHRACQVFCVRQFVLVIGGG